jgi:GNAT superfamily N-acetyltransferase
LIPALESSDAALETIASELFHEWGGGSIEQRTARLRVDKCAFLMSHRRTVTDDIITIMGHIRLQRAMHSQHAASSSIATLSHSPNGKTESSSSISVNDGDAEFRANNNAILSVPDAVLTSVIICKKYRNKGYGKVLMNLIETYALSEGYGYLYLYTNNAHQFYRSIGYRECKSVTSEVDSLKHLDTAFIRNLENLFLKKHSEQVDKDSSMTIMQNVDIENFTFVDIDMTHTHTSASGAVYLKSGEGAKLSAIVTGGNNVNLVWYNITDYQSPEQDPEREIIRTVSLFPSS